MRAFVLALLAAASCAELPAMPAGACGNGVVEEGEQCDTVAVGEGTECESPGVVNACRYVCDSDGTPACPAGWSCGDDGACRHASGAFAPVSGSPWRFFADGFVIGDIDGDEIDDLIGHRASGLHVRFGSDDGQFRTEFLRNTDIQVGAPAIADLDGDDRLDIVATGAGGLTGFLGQADRSLAPIVYGSFDLPLTSRFVMIRPSAAAEELPLVITDAGMVFHDRGGQAIGPVEPLPAGALVGFLQGDIPVDEDVFALAFSFTQDLYVYGTTKNDTGEAYVTLLQTLPLPAPMIYGARFADMDGDGVKDLMISLQMSTPVPPEGCAFGGTIEDKVAIALGNGDGTFLPPVVDDAFDALVVSCCSSRSWPVAVGNLNGEGSAEASLADAVGDQAICIRTAAGFVNHGGNPSGGFFESVIGDFNRDGANDIAAGDNSGVTFFLGNDTGYFTLHRQETFLQPQQLRTGDFDGDFVTDLAFVLVGGTDQRVEVAYGQLQGGPVEAVTTARFAAVHRIQPSDLGGDLPTDLVIHGNARSTGVDPGNGGMPGGPEPDPSGVGEDPSLSFLLGNSQRGMVSPLPLRGTYSSDTPLAAFVGDFDQSGIGDILAVADPWQDGIYGRRFWLLPGAEGAQFNRDDAMTHVIEDPARIAGCGTWHATDLDGAGGPPDLVVFDTCPFDPDTGEQLPGLIMVGHVTVDGTTLDVTLDREVLSDPVYAGPQRAILADATGDGIDDLIVVYSYAMMVEEGELGAPAVAVYPNTGGAFDLAAPRLVTRYLYLDGSEWWVSPVDAAPINADEDVDLELAILTSNGVFVADWNGTGYEGARLAIEATVFFGARIRAADVDSDGLGDLVYVGNGEAHVWRSVPADF